MTILLVEANHMTSRTMQQWLLDLGYTDVTKAWTGEDAWNRLIKRRFNALVIDWTLPDMNGLDLVKRIRAAETHRHIILLLANKRFPQDVLEAVEAGSDAYLIKPVNEEAFKSNFARLVEE